MHAILPAYYAEAITACAPVAMIDGEPVHLVKITLATAENREALVKSGRQVIAVGGSAGHPSRALYHEIASVSHLPRDQSHYFRQALPLPLAP